MTDHTNPEPTPTVAEQMVRELGIAPALSRHEAADQLVESVRSQTDDVVDRAKVELQHTRDEAHEQSLRSGPENWGTGGAPAKDAAP